MQEQIQPADEEVEAGEESDDSLQKDLKEIYGSCLVSESDRSPKRLPQSDDESDDEPFLNPLFRTTPVTPEKQKEWEEEKRKDEEKKREFEKQKQAEKEDPPVGNPKEYCQRRCKEN